MCIGHQVALDDKIYHGMGILKGLIQDIGPFLFTNYAFFGKTTCFLEEVYYN